jgi:hypothetical protein
VEFSVRAANQYFWRIPRQLGAALLLFGLLASGPHLAPQNDELSLRAAYLLNLTKYVDWPPSQKRIVVEVVGDNSTATAIQQLLNNKVTEGRPLEVVVHPSDSELRSCDIVYFDRSARSATQSVREKLHGVRCITVGDNDQFVYEGGMVGLVRSGDQIQIFVNVDATERENVVLSSRLLNLAVLVHSSRRPH